MCKNERYDAIDKHSDWNEEEKKMMSVSVILDLAGRVKKDWHFTCIKEKRSILDKPKKISAANLSRIITWTKTQLSMVNVDIA